MKRVYNIGLTILFFMLALGCNSKPNVQIVNDLSFQIIDQDGDPVPYIDIPIDNDIGDGDQEIGNILGTTNSSGMIYRDELEARTYDVEYDNRAFTIDEHDASETIVIDILVDK